MLQTIRDKTTGTAALIVVGVICVPFAFFGIEQFASGGADPALAKVGGEKITQRQFSNQYDRSYQRFQQMLGDNFDPALVQSPQFRQGVLQSLIEQRLMTAHIDSVGYSAGEAQAFDAIRSQQAFQVGDEFSPDAYKRTLQAQGMRADNYESLVKQDIARFQLESGVRGSSFAVPGEVELAYRLEHQTRRFQQLTFAQADYRDSIELSEDELRARYDADPEQFRTDERVRVAYIDVNAATLSADGEPTEEELRALYEAEKARFSTPEERLTRHILIKVDDDTDSDAAQAQIEALRTRIVEGGEDFAELATAESEDAGSARDGGSLDWVRRGMMVTPFEEAMFALEEGAVSEPVETDFGWHLIRVDEVREPDVTPFDDASVQAQLTETYQRRLAEEQFQAIADEVEQLTFENPESLQVAAEAVGLEVQQSPWFSRAGGAGIASIGDVVETAFSPEVLDLEENSAMIGVGSDRAIVLRKLAYEPSEVQPFEDVEPQLRSAMLGERAREKARAEADIALAMAQDGQSLTEIAEALDKPLVDSGNIERNESTGRNDASLNPQVVRTAFGMPGPAAGQPSLEVVQTATGDAVLIALKAVKPPAVPNKDSAERSTLQARLRGGHANEELTGLQSSLRDRISVKVYEDRLNADDEALGS
ncbi:hypothetical protein GYB61_06645 [bacterium]|nr:hypothetical protein [bacterium]